MKQLIMRSSPNSSAGRERPPPGPSPGRDTRATTAFLIFALYLPQIVVLVCEGALTPRFFNRRALLG